MSLIVVEFKDEVYGIRIACCIGKPEEFRAWSRRKNLPLEMPEVNDDGLTQILHSTNGGPSFGIVWLERMPRDIASCGTLIHETLHLAQNTFRRVEAKNVDDELLAYQQQYYYERITELLKRRTKR